MVLDILQEIPARIPSTKGWLERLKDRHLITGLADPFDGIVLKQGEHHSRVLLQLLGLFFLDTLFFIEECEAVLSHSHTFFCPFRALGAIDALVDIFTDTQDVNILSCRHEKSLDLRGGDNITELVVHGRDGIHALDCGFVMLAEVFQSVIQCCKVLVESLLYLALLKETTA